MRQIGALLTVLEKASNASLEEIVMALKVRNDLNPYKTGINTKNIYHAVNLLALLLG